MEKILCFVLLNNKEEMRFVEGKKRWIFEKERWKDIKEKENKILKVFYLLD